MMEITRQTIDKMARYNMDLNPFSARPLSIFSNNLLFIFEVDKLQKYTQIYYFLLKFAINAFCMQASDQYIVERLLARDGTVTREFFYVWCKPLLYSLIRRIFDYQVDYDELVNELYLYLLSDDGHRLRSFQGRSSIYQWLKCVAVRFFIGKRDAGLVIEDAGAEPLYPSDEPSSDSEDRADAAQDVPRFLSMMSNPRHRMVLRRLLIEGYDYRELAAELDTSVANLYNIKKRALTEFTAIVLKEYGKE